MKEIFEIAGAVILGLGGGGTIVFAMSSWLGKIWAQRIISKEELSNNYILHLSQVQFEREYKIYSQIWMKMLTLKWDTLSMMPRLDYLPEDKASLKDVYFKRYDKHIKSLTDFYKEVYSNAPFISEEIYNELLEIGELCRNQGNEFSVYKLELDEDVRTYEEIKEYYKSDEKLKKKVSDITNLLRKYLKRYKIQEI